MSGVRKTGASSPGTLYGLPRSREQLDTPANASRSDSAGITTAARELGRSLQVVEAADDVRAERVAALRERIQNGTYAPDPREVARKLLERGF